MRFLLQHISVAKFLIDTNTKVTIKVTASTLTRGNSRKNVKVYLAKLW